MTTVPGFSSCRSYMGQSGHCARSWASDAISLSPGACRIKSAGNGAAELEDSSENRIADLGRDENSKGITVRQRNLKSPVSVVTIKRALKATAQSGLAVASMEVRPDGAIILNATNGPPTVDDVFEKWAEKL